MVREDLATELLEDAGDADALFARDPVAEFKAREIAAEDAAILGAIKALFEAGAFEELEIT